jgi:phosphoglycolate phosphatase-like HAD superfamily hydrolase
VLFDIDGTLLRCGPQIRDIFGGSLLESFGTMGAIEGYSFAGRTDHGIVHDLMVGAGMEEEEVLERLPGFRDLYLRRLDEELDASRMRVLPGVPELLEDLVGREEVLLGLLTGNWELGAQIKLSRASLDGFFGFGAFGDGQHHRVDLPPIALQRAKETKDDGIDAEHTVIVGDSELDVECARAHGIRSLAVETGFSSGDALNRAGADRVVPDLLEGLADLCALGLELRERL